MLRPALLLITCLILAGCGQSGPLFLPGDPSEVKSIPPQSEESKEQEDNGERPRPNN